MREVLKMDKKHTQIKQKSVFLLVIIALIAMLLCLPGTLAAFLADTKAQNHIDFGGVNLKIIQTSLNEQGQEEVFDSKEATNIATKAIQSRIIRVKNTGSHPLYVRVQPQFKGIDSQGKPIDILAFTEYEINTADWIYKDGWYYYLHILEPDKVSELLLDELIFDVNQITSKYPGSTFDIDFYVQGVQSEHQNTLNVLEVTGWPKQ